LTRPTSSTTRAAAKATAIRTNITNMMATNAALFSSKYTEYVTPKKLYEELDKEFHFALDAATTKDNPLNTSIYFTKEDNALSKDWHYTVIDSQGVRRNAVYVNPPYTSRNIVDWIKKAREESVKHGITIVMLLPSRTDTRWFHDYIYRKPNVEHRFIRGRLKFKVDTSIQAVPNTDPFPSMIAIFRP
jgi:site-specific DNA-methyltransferase (adenine-specific)